ncbi:Hypothetical predicted protein [Mytilus galloprovincialis]|uniref:Uncharacterized protein n=1 Tax=Mytilus galloprovincialis TaxID=29158 RepID=A0A8B6HLF8_MYTGA|nr:Hypothetical predicted protein [Mytilus galloprovincialis]
MFEEAAHVQSNSASSAGLVGMMEQIEDVMNLSKEMTVSLKQCLTQFKQQEEVRDSGFQKPLVYITITIVATDKFICDA